MYPLKSNINYFVKENNDISNNKEINNNNFIEEDFFDCYDRDNYDSYFENNNNNNNNLKENDVLCKNFFNKDDILYRGLKYLNKNKLNTENIKNINNIFLVPYHISNNENNAFIQILLNKNKNKNNNEISFLKIDNYEDKEKLIENYCFNYLLNVIFDIIKIYKNSFSCYDNENNYIDDYNIVNDDYNINDEEKIKKNNKYKGYKLINNNLYLFFDISVLNIDNFYINKSNPFWFCSYDEIINSKKICNFNINNDVCYFFNNNMYFLQIENKKNNELYEIPIIVYTGNTIQKIKFQNIFGNIKTDNYFGDYYYFTTYNEAVKNSLQKLDNNEEVLGGGISKFALFLKKIKYIINDDDYLKNWEDKYDSLYVSNKNFMLNNVPCWIIKDYNNQYPLTYHITSLKIEDLEKYKMNNFIDFNIV